MKRTHTILTITSAIGCGLLLVLYAVSYHLDARTQTITITSWVHLGFADGGAYFYNHERPWLDGIIDMSGTNSSSSAMSGWHIGRDYGYSHSSEVMHQGSDSGLLVVTIFNFPGTRFREVSYFWMDRPIWTFLLSLWYPILLLAILPAWWFFRRWPLPLRRSENGRTMDRPHTHRY